jgi:hypothetical protein
MRTFLISIIALPLLCSSAAFAQVGMITGAPATLGVTSPLGIGPGAPAGATGIPLGATELATPGVSPSASTGMPSSMMTTTTSACSTMGGSMQTGASGMGSSSVGATGAVNGESPATGAVSGTSAPTALFDGAGISGTASGTCPSTTVSSSPTGSASSPSLASRSTVGRVGIPMGSTELSTGGVSPLPDITTQSLAPSVSTGTSMVPCPTTTTGTSMSSSGC